MVVDIHGEWTGESVRFVVEMDRLSVRGQAVGVNKEVIKQPSSCCLLDVCPASMLVCVRFLHELHVPHAG